MWSELNEHIKNINNLAGIFWDTGDLDPWEMFRLIVSKKALLEYLDQYPLQKPEYEEILEKIIEVEREYYKDVLPLPEGFKKISTENAITTERFKELLKEFIELVKECEFDEVVIKSFLQMYDQRLL